MKDLVATYTNTTLKMLLAQIMNSFHKAESKQCIVSSFLVHRDAEMCCVMPLLSSALTDLCLLSPERCRKLQMSDYNNQAIPQQKKLINLQLGLRDTGKNIQYTQYCCSVL